MLLNSKLRRNIIVIIIDNANLSDSRITKVAKKWG